MPAPHPSGDKSSRTVVVIPARLKSVRLPSKPMADIHGEPMIVHVWRRAVAAEIGRVIVAAAEGEIAEAVTRAGGEAVLTDPELPSGTDRIFAALEAVDGERRYGRVVNLQGDLPTLDPATLRAVLEPIDRLGTDIATLVHPIHEARERTSPDVVKAVIAFSGADLGRALYFTRATAPFGEGPLYHHIGIYAFKRAALHRFAGLAPSPLERRERLEQLRALEAGMSIGCRVVDAVPFGVDTPADLERARALLRE